MPFDLTVAFTGMNLFVPGADRIYTLLPSTPPEMPHLAELRFASQYLAGGDGTGDPYRTVLLQDWSLDLTGLTGQGGIVALPPGLPDVGAAVGRPIPLRQLGPSPDDGVAARVTLPAPTRMLRVHGGYWDLGYQMDVEMTHSVLWTLEGVPDDALRWGLYGLRRFMAEPLPELRPVDGRIELEVLHLPDDDVPDDPPCGTPAYHFGAYYGLFGPNVEGPLPLFRAPPLEHACDVLPPPIPAFRYGSFYTCMMAMSPAGGS